MSRTFYNFFIFSNIRDLHPGRPYPRFPADGEQRVQGEIARRLQALNAGFGYASAACGADILFLEEMIRRNGETTVILPVEMNSFRQKSVDHILPGSDWGMRFDRLLKKAARIITANERQAARDQASYQYANILEYGLAILGAKILDTEMAALAVWDGRPGDGPWGTASMVELWRSHGLEPEIIDIRALGETKGPNRKTEAPVALPSSNATHTAGDRSEYPREIKAMLFADVFGYAQLMEEQIPHFVSQFMGLVAELIRDTPYQPLTKNTWGDALYFVFPSTEAAGNFALELRDRVVGTYWEDKGLPRGLNLRISLHAGPVYQCRDPVTEHLKYTGSHVSRAARIEPITPPGQVYASQGFAAFSAVQQVKGFRFDYAGQVPLPKQSGIIPLYLVRRNQAGTGLG